MENVRDNDFYLGKTRYSISADEQGCHRQGDSYYECFTIYKDNEYWSVVEIGITNIVCVKWTKIIEIEIDLNKFLSQIATHIIKIGIYNDEVSEIEEGGKVKSCFLLSSKAKNSNQIQVLSTPDETLAFNQRVAKISSKISPYYLFAYLSTEIARLQSERNALGIRQRNVGINDLKNVKVALPSPNVQIVIDNLISQYLSELERSKSLYSQAENLLLEELGLKDFEVEEDRSYVVNLSDVKSAHRADAEYFQPKYERLMKEINKKYNTKHLGDLCSIKKGFEPGSGTYQDEGKLFIRVSNIASQGLVDRDQKYLSEELYEELCGDFEPKVREILLTKDATPGIAYMVKDPVEGIISGGILRIKVSDEYDAEYIALCINSIIGKSQAERGAGGSIIAHWKPDQIRNLQIPILLKPAQQKIASLVCQSHQARRKAKELLEEAKRKVEKMILGNE